MIDNIGAIGADSFVWNNFFEIVETFLGSFVFELPRALSVYVGFQFWCSVLTETFLRKCVCNWSATHSLTALILVSFLFCHGSVHFRRFFFGQGFLSFFPCMKNKPPLNFLKNSLFPTSFTNDAQERSAFGWQTSPGGNLKQGGFEHDEVVDHMSDLILDLKVLCLMFLSCHP